MAIRTRETSDAEIARLVAEAVGGNSTAFAALVRATQRYAYALAFRFLADAEDAKDAVQEAFVRVWKHLPEFDPSRTFTTWLYTIVTNLCMDRLRSKRRWNLLFGSTEGRGEPVDPTDLEAVHSDAELGMMIRRLTSSLSPTQREVFVLRDLQDCPVDEVVRITGLSEGSVRTNLHLARKAIRAMMKTRYGVEEQAK